MQTGLAATSDNFQTARLAFQLVNACERIGVDAAALEDYGNEAWEAYLEEEWRVRRQAQAQRPDDGGTGMVPGSDGREPAQG